MAQLLTIVTIGLAVVAMHALGHPSEHECPAGLGHSHGAADVHHAGAGDGGLAAVSVLTHAAGTSPARAADPLTPGGGGHPGTCGDPTAMCLAVLTLGGLLLGLAAAGRGVKGVRRYTGKPGTSRTHERLDSPPGPGLLLTRVSVLRI
jgi:hypothetical protein